MSKFCHECGKQVPVGAKFCNECGTNLASLANKPTPPTPTTPLANAKRPGQFTPFAVGREDGDDSYIDNISHLDIRQNELQVEIIKDRPMGESVGAVITQGIGAGSAPTVEPRPAQYTDREAFLKDFQREAGPRNEKQSHHID